MALAPCVGFGIDFAFCIGIESGPNLAFNLAFNRDLSLQFRLRPRFQS